jgi:aldose 1-epimerase
VPAVRPALGSLIVSELFGILGDGTAVERHVLRSDRLEVGVLSYGGVLQSVSAPDRDGARADVVLGFDDLDDYVEKSPYFGALVGRYANRIAGARFSLNDRSYELPANNGPNTLHGGPDGFDKRVWAVDDSTAGALRLTLESPDGDEGFPARLRLAVTYTLAGDRLRLDYEATNVEPDGGPATVVNLTNHTYWNLAGEGAGSVAEHELRVIAGRYLPIDETSIPLGDPAPVEGTPFDFRAPTAIGARWRQGHDQLAVAGGYDHNYCLDGADGGAPVRDGLALAAVVAEPGSGRVLEVWTDQPGVQLYSGNKLTGSLRGKAGRLYRAGDAFCLETQHWPDSPNHPGYPSTVLGPQQTFRTSTVFGLTVP